jgi:hypothetical protein
LCVDAAVQLNRQPARSTIKVHHVASQRMLPAELQPRNGTAAQQPPRCPLRFRHCSAQLPRASCLFLHRPQRTLTRPSADGHPLPKRERAKVRNKCAPAHPNQQTPTSHSTPNPLPFRERVSGEARRVRVSSPKPPPACSHPTNLSASAMLMREARRAGKSALRIPTPAAMARHNPTVAAGTLKSARKKPVFMTNPTPM